MPQTMRAPFSVPNWIVSGILGLALGAGGTYVGILNYQAAQDKTSLSIPALATPKPSGEMPVVGGEAPALSIVMARKWNLVSLVGKLEMLSRSDLNLRLELTSDQVQAMVGILDQIDQAKTMTAEEAQTRLVELD